MCRQRQVEVVEESKTLRPAEASLPPRSHVADPTQRRAQALLQTPPLLLLLNTPFIQITSLPLINCYCIMPADRNNPSSRSSTGTKSNRPNAGSDSSIDLTRLQKSEHPAHPPSANITQETHVEHDSHAISLDAANTGPQARAPPTNDMQSRPTMIARNSNRAMNPRLPSPPPRTTVAILASSRPTIADESDRAMKPRLPSPPPRTTVASAPSRPTIANDSNREMKRTLQSPSPRFKVEFSPVVSPAAAALPQQNSLSSRSSSSSQIQEVQSVQSRMVDPTLKQRNLYSSTVPGLFRSDYRAMVQGGKAKSQLSQIQMMSSNTQTLDARPQESQTPSGGLMYGELRSAPHSLTTHSQKPRHLPSPPGISVGLNNDGQTQMRLSVPGITATSSPNAPPQTGSSIAAAGNFVARTERLPKDDMDVDRQDAAEAAGESAGVKTTSMKKGGPSTGVSGQKKVVTFKEIVDMRSSAEAPLTVADVSHSPNISFTESVLCLALHHR